MNKSGLLPVELAASETVDAHFKKREKLCFVLGVSGGIDSTCLLHIFANLDIKVIAVHINYKTRGEASKKDADFVGQTCKQLNVENRVFEIDSKDASYSNFQAWARKVRYDCFEKVAREANATGIAVAHNEDDQVETILQKIFRGSGLAGWAAMQIWDGRLFRPLLNISRKEIEQYCKENNIDYRVDSSNLENKYARNFLRNEWLPQLAQHFPGWRTNILRAADQAEVFKSALEYIFQDIGVSENEVERNSFLALPLPLQKSLLLLFVQKADPDVSLSKDALRELPKLKKLQTGKKIQLADALYLMRDRNVFKLMPDENHTGKSLEIRIEQLTKGPITYENLELSMWRFEKPDFANTLYLDAEKLRWPLHLRSWREGDKIQPLGMTGHQTVADHLTNRKIGAAEKPKAMVVEDFEETIAAVIFPSAKKAEPGTISELFKCTASTDQTLIIKNRA